MTDRLLQTMFDSGATPRGVESTLAVRPEMDFDEALGRKIDTFSLE
jgi:hypothetical protein